ncbi:MAG TPA: phosphotransferase family protein [Nocardioidaceae bacterium]|nr:phosphotransferase family protein [Nocardioidaceae bacterium]
MSTRTRLATAELPAALLPMLRQQLGQDSDVTGWRPAPRGFSTETTLFDYGSTPLVLRRPPELPLFPDYDLLRQVKVMQRLAVTDIPVPHVHWLDRGDDLLGSPYYVMDRLAGDAPGDFPSYHSEGLYHDASPAQRAKMWWGCVDVMADVHRLDWRALDLSFLGLPDFGTRPLEQVVNYLDDALAWATDIRPRSLSRAIGWLRSNLYEPEHLTLCWGDARLSNVLYDADFEVAGVLDWEIAYLGDHEADLAWLLFLDWANSEYEGIPRLPGTPTRAETIAHYERRSGMAVRNLVYNEVLAAVLLAVPLLRITEAFQLPADTTAFCTRRIDELLEES